MTKVRNVLKICLVLAVAVLAAVPADADIMGFQSDYAPGNWTTTFGGPGALGSVNTGGAPASISLTSGNDDASPIPEYSDVDFTIALTTGGTLSFDWDYVTSDAGGAFYDRFGYLLNGAFIPLSNNGGGEIQSGTVNLLNLLDTDVFGFRQTSEDNYLGSATTTISNFSGPGDAAAVPEPGSFALLTGMALTGFCYRRRNRK